MRKITICFVCMLQYSVLSAQSIGIGTNSPNSSALLHLNSTSKGLLMPRMSTTERNSIALPAEGLLIYNITTNHLNQRQNGAWKILLNNDSWTGGGSGQIFNIGDNVGINTAGPAERLDVSGNIRSNGSIIVDNATAILQFKSAGVSSGYVQLSGESLRLGTNSGNITGNVVVRMNGNDRITINPAGDLATAGEINRAGLGTADFLPICYGRVDKNGNPLMGGSGNFFVSRNGSGAYTIFVNNETAADKIVLITPTAEVGGRIASTSTILDADGGTNILVFIQNLAGVMSDGGFHFLVIRE